MCKLAIEKNISNLLSKKEDAAVELFQTLESIDSNEFPFLDFCLQDELMACLSGNRYEEDIWNMLLPKIPSGKISDNVIRYLIQNGISSITLGHMQLENKWLIKLAKYDDAPLYTLAERYYLSDEYTNQDFLQFYNQHLHKRGDISLFLLNLYGNVEKRSLLIFLCSNDERFVDKEQLHYHQVANKVRGLVDPEDILSVYRSYSNIGTILLEVASNLFAPEELLLEMLSIKGIKGAHQIRQRAKITLALKKQIE